MNVGEFGNILRYNVKEDITTSTNTVTFVDPTGKETTRDAPVGLADVQTDRGKFSAGEYIEYTFAQGDIPIPGTWQCRVNSEFSTKTLKSDLTPFKVKP